LESELKLAFQIERFGGDGPIRVYLENGSLWWPVGSGGPDLDRFLGSLRRGYRGVIGLIGARIRESYKWRIKDKIESREVLYSWRDDALGRAHLAAQNILLVDGKRAYIRGGYPLLSFYGSRNFPDETYLDACNSGFEYGRPLPIELSADKGANWDAEVNVRLFVARGQVLSLEQNNLTRLGEIHCEIAPLPFDLAESRLQLLCRDLLESVDDNKHLPFQVRRNGLTVLCLGPQSRPTSEDCVHAVTNLRGWLSELDPTTRRKFRDAARLLQSRISNIDEAYRRSGRPSAFALEPVDDEAIAGLSL